jgi:TolB protein
VDPDLDFTQLPALLLDADDDLATPAWSPDGTKIAYAAELDVGGSEPGIHVLTPGGGPPVRLTTEPDVAPCWSPDGTMIVFTWSEYLLGSRLCTMRANGSDAEEIPGQTSLNQNPSWR